MYKIPIEQIRKDLSKKQAHRFKKLMKEFEGYDKLDIIYKLAKKRRGIR